MPQLFSKHHYQVVRFALFHCRRHGLETGTPTPNRADWIILTDWPPTRHFSASDIVFMLTDEQGTGSSCNLSVAEEGVETCDAAARPRCDRKYCVPACTRISISAVRFRTDSEPEPNPNRTSVQVRALAKDWTEPQVRFGVRRLLDFSGPVRTCANLCEPQIFFASNSNIRQNKFPYANLLGVSRGVEH
jgi:hypothetical protein